jgi:hypothetical protein
MRRIVITAALATALVAPAARAGDQQATYVTGYVQWNVPTQQVGIGGYQFPAGAKPLKVKVVDADGPGVPVYVCQNPNGDTFCGDTGEPVFRACSEGGFITLPTNFKAGAATTVFVLIADSTLSCEVQPTTGTITLRS